MAEHSPIKPWTEEEIDLLMAQMPKVSESDFWVSPQETNLDGIEPCTRRVTPQNLGIVIAAARDGRLLDLSLRQREILGERYLSENPGSFRNLAKRLKVTRQRVGQIEVSALKRLQRTAVSTG